MKDMKQNVTGSMKVRGASGGCNNANSILQETRS